MFQIFSFILTTLFELPMIQNKILFNLILVKHIYAWFVHDLIFSTNDISVIILQLNSILAVGMMCNIAAHLKNKLSYQRYKIGRELEDSKEKFKTITKSFSDGFIILTDFNKIIFANDNALGLLNCPLEEVFLNICKFEYNNDKKVNSYTASNFLIDDIKRAFES